MPRTIRPTRLSGYMSARSQQMAPGMYTPTTNNVSARTIGINPVSAQDVTAVPSSLSTEAANGIGINVGSVLNGVAPYVTNIVNSFRRVPRPKSPTYMNPVVLPKANLNAAREATNRGYKSMTKAADTNLDENTAAILKAAGLGQNLEQLSNINEKEQLLDQQRTAQQAQMNQQVDYVNTSRREAFNDKNLEADIAQQTNQAANLANATDKFIAISNQNAAEKLDRDKLAITSRLFDAGVYDRFQEYMKNQGVTVPKRLGGHLKVYAAGGELTGPNTAATAPVKAPAPSVREDFDIRDSIMSLVGKGYTGLNDDDARGNYARLTAILGKDNAMKLSNHIFLNNQNPMYTRMTPEQRVSAYFGNTINDPYLSELITRVKGLGYGVPNGMQTSPYVNNMQLTGRLASAKKVY